MYSIQPNRRDVSGAASAPARGALTRGEFRGEVLRRRQVAGLVLTETRYRPHLTIRRHRHENSYICLVTCGSYTERFGGSKRDCGPMTLAFHPAQEVHEERFNSDEVRSFNIEPGIAWAERLGPERGILDSPAEFRGGRLAWLALGLYHEFVRMDEVSALAIEGLLLEMLAETARMKRTTSSSRVPRWLTEARDILCDRFNENLSVAELAETVGVHPVYLATEFRKSFRCTMGEYVRQLRVDYACRELSGADAPLADIAVAAGFADQSHFCRTFKRLIGVTPARYRATTG